MLAIFAYHLRILDGWALPLKLEGAFVSLDLFFVLSGFLITSLLFAQRARNGQVRLREFWARRALRLVPALVAVLLVMVPLVLLLSPDDHWARIRDQGLATLFYVGNWHHMFPDDVAWLYLPLPLDHTWSLAVEEQFYAAWPLIFTGVTWLAARFIGARRAGSEPLEQRTVAAIVGVVALIGSLASYVSLAWRYDAQGVDQAFHSTDSRVGAILLGCALAAWRTRYSPHQNAKAEGSRSSWVAGMVAAGWILFLMVALEDRDELYFKGAGLSVVIAAAVVIATSTGNHQNVGPVTKALSWRPLRAAGIISYSMYLWHWPVIVYARPLYISWIPYSRFPAQVFRLVVTILLAAATYKLIEAPMRRRGQRRSKRTAAEPAAAAQPPEPVALSEATA